MALFSRKNRPQDEDTVHLASADHSWWTGDPAPDGHDVDRGDVEADVAARIADALQEYGFAGDVETAPASSAEPGRGAVGGLAAASEEGSLFTHDGLPAEDRLAELLGALRLEGDADWVDIARAHRRLVGSTAGHLEADGESQRRAANEAYACLRLFHH